MPRPPKNPRDAALRIVEALRDAGHVAYLAGGCVRDRLLGLTPKDYDVATDAVPERVTELFSNCRLVGEAFGVVLVRLKSCEVEVATFRAESGYEDGRRPTRVAFTDAEHDALRRDFTVNGLFEDPFADDPAKQVIDFVGGQADLRARVIRTIGDPAVRFGEDYLRMLRAVRFAARLGFTIDPDTEKTITTCAPRLAAISRERIGQEVQWMLGAAGVAGAALKLIQKTRLDGPTLNEDPADPPLATVDALTARTDPPTDPPPYAAMLCAWMLDRYVFTDPLAEPTPPHTDGLVPDHPVPADPIARIIDFARNAHDHRLAQWRAALCLSNTHREAARDTLTGLAAALTWPTLRVAAKKRLLAADHWPATHRLLDAIRHEPAVGPVVEQLDRDAEILFAQGVAPTPLVTGDDLIAAGFNPGPWFGRLLSGAYDAQLEGKIATRQEAIEWVGKLADGRDLEPGSGMSGETIIGDDAGPGPGSP